MARRTRKLQRELAGADGLRAQRGQAIVLIAIMLAVVVGMAALAIDGARAYALRRDLQAAVDSAALAAGDSFQQRGSYSTAEQAATTIFGENLRIYGAPACAPGYGAPGASPLTVTCTFSDGTSLTQVVTALGAQGSQFRLTAARSLQLQFAKILTNGSSPTLAASAVANVNNLRATPAIAALDQAGCGGAGGTAISINGSGTLNVNGDVVSNGAVSVSSGTLQVTGDLYARCQSPVPGSVANACYPSGASPPCSYPDVAGATRSGFRLADPVFPPPNLAGGSQGLPNTNVVLLSGIYSGLPILNGGHCWFLGGGVYDFQAGLANLDDFMSNELKPPDEPNASDNTVRSPNQFWNTNGTQCAGAVQISVVGGPRGIPVGNWAFVLTSVRTDTYNGVSYRRESAPSMCYPTHVDNSGQNVLVAVSNVPGATAYNIYASPPAAGGTCIGAFGFAATLPVSGLVQNNNTTPCPLPVGGGCSLGNESMRLDATQLGSPFAPNGAAAAGTTGSYPPDAERAPLVAGLPNQNPARGSGSTGDRANENNCETAVGAYTACPAPVTAGAVELYVPSGGCLVTSSGGDTYLFSGYQYNWVSVYAPPANACLVGISAATNSAYIGLVYTPGAVVSVTSPYAFESPGMGGVIADAVSFSGTLPAIAYSSSYAPVPPAARLTG